MALLTGWASLFLKDELNIVIPRRSNVARGGFIQAPHNNSPQFFKSRGTNRAMTSFFHVYEESAGVGTILTLRRKLWEQPLY
jgi:hypothetical protein